MRSLIRPLSALVVVFGLLFALAVAAGAQTGYQFDRVRDSCSEPGTTNSIHGNFFAPGSPVSVVLQGSTIATIEAGADGVVDGIFTVPANASTGQATIQLVGQSNVGAPRTLTFTFQIGGCTAPAEGVAGGAEVGGGAGGGGVLAFTGGNIGLIVGIGAAATVLGVAAYVGARRRHGALGTSSD